MATSPNSNGVDGAIGSPAKPVLLVSQAFKGTHTVLEVARAMEYGAGKAGFATDTVLGADGGDGFVQILDENSSKNEEIAVAGPLGSPVSVRFLWLEPGVAVIESRLVCGLSLVPSDRRDPSRTTTRGLGEAISALEARGAKKILVGLGGSATMDGGTAMASAWGWRFEDEEGKNLSEGGGRLRNLTRIVPGLSPVAELVGIADVTNPLYGPSGARVYARQKGANAEMEDLLDRGLRRLAEVSGEEGPEGLAKKPGAGAAGGLGFGLMAFGGGKLQNGSEWVLERARFNDRLEGAKAVIVAEAGFDRTSQMGKLSGEVLRRTLAAGVPVGLAAPTASHVPDGVVLETGGGFWDLDEVARRTESLLGKVVRLPQG